VVLSTRAPSPPRRCTQSIHSEPARRASPWCQSWCEMTSCSDDRAGQRGWPADSCSLELAVVRIAVALIIPGSWVRVPPAHSKSWCDWWRETAANHGILRRAFGTSPPPLSDQGSLGDGGTSAVPAPPPPRRVQQHLVDPHADRAVHHREDHAFGQAGIQASRSGSQQETTPEQGTGGKREPPPPAENQADQVHRGDHRTHLPHSSVRRERTHPEAPLMPGAY
jgi:hypothetical protein